MVLSQNELLNLIKKKVIPTMDDMVSEDLFFNKMVSNIEKDSQKVLTEFMWLRNLMKEQIPWELKNLDTRLYIMRKEFPSEFIIQFIDKVDIGEGPAFTPVMVTYATISPKVIPRDLKCSYKSLWLNNDLTDQILNEITINLNHEHPGLDNYLEEFFTGRHGKDTYPFEYEDFEKKGRKEKIRISRTLHEPFIIKNVQLTNKETKEEETKTILFLSYFLQSESKKYKGVRSPGLVIRIFEDTFSALERFMVVGKDESGEILIASDIEPDDENIELKSERCPECGWILSVGRDICPMCKKDVTLLNTSEEHFSAAASLENIEDLRKVNNLMNALKDIIEEEDPDRDEAEEMINNAIKDSIKEDEISKEIVAGINSNVEELSEIYKPLIKTVQNELIMFEIQPFNYLEIITKELTFKSALMIQSLIKEEYTDYYPAIISYITTIPRFPVEVILNARINPYSERREITWTSDGDDLGLCKKLNGLKFKEFTVEVFGGEEQRYASHFQAKKRDILDRLVDVEGMEYELPFMIKISTFHPRLKGAPTDKSFLIMNQFLKSKAERYSGFIPFSKTLVLLDAIIAGVELVYDQLTNKTKETDSQEPEPSVDDGIVDSSILGDDDDFDWGDDKEEEEIDLSVIDGAIGEIEEPDEEDIPESLLESIKGPRLKDVREMERLEREKQLQEAKQVKISEMKVSEEIFEFDDILGDPTTSEPQEPEGPPPLPPELVEQCQKYEIDPNMDMAGIDQKAKELKFQRENLNDMIAQARDAQAQNLITPEQLNQQMEMIKNEAMKLNEQIMLVEQLRHLKV